MPLVRGTIKRGELLDKIVTAMTTTPVGANEPYWKAVQTGKVADEGYVLYSKGKSGRDDIYIRIIDSSPSYGYLYVSIMETYKPNPVLGLSGTIVGESPQARMEFCNANYPSYRPMEYFLSFDKDKMMLSLAGNPAVHSYSTRVFLWAGMPNRISDEPNSNAVTIALSRRAYEFSNYQNTTNNSQAYGTAYTLRNRKYLAGRGGGNPSTVGYSQDSIYSLHVPCTAKSKGWGGKISLFPMHLNRSDEGLRARMSGIHPIYQDANNMDFLDGDEITVGSKRYSVFQVHEDLTKTSGNSPIGGSYSVNCFPSIFMAVEHLS